MRTFSIDLASHDGHLACVEDDRVVALKSVTRVNDTDLIPYADDVIKKAGWAPKDIERVVCNLGPGGFTSVRSGVTFANALAHQLGVPLSGYHGSELTLERSPSATLWLHSTRAEQLFVRGGKWTEPALISLDDALAALNSGTVVTGDCTEEHRTVLVERGALFAEKQKLEAVLPTFLQRLSYEHQSLLPWYGRQA